MSSEICLHNANLLTGYSVMNNCAVLLKSYKIIDVFNENRFARKNLILMSSLLICRALTLLRALWIPIFTASAVMAPMT